MTDNATDEMAAVPDDVHPELRVFQRLQYGIW